MSLPRVLIAAPTAEDKDYCFEEYAEQVLNFDYQNYDVLLVDNSEDFNYCKKILERGISCAYVPRGEHSPLDYVTRCQNLIAEYAKQNGYDYIFFLETDVFVPKWMLSYLVAHRYPVHNLTYYVRQEEATRLSVMGVGGRSKFYGRQMLIPNECIGDLWRGEIEPIRNMKIGEDYEMVNPPLGCSLVATWVFEKISFHTHKDRHPTAFADSYFHLDVRNHKLPNYLNTKHLAFHDRRTWLTNLYFKNGSTTTGDKELERKN